jgi:hypothetical protein
LTRAASGLEAGVVGGLAMQCVLITFSLLRGRVWWETPNLLGSTFYGLRAFRAGVGVVTLSGLALHVVITGIFGIVFGLVCGSMSGRSRLVVVGLAAGVVWFYLADALLWSRLNPLVPLYTFAPAGLISHGVFGACLGWIGQNQNLGTQKGAQGPPPMR